MLNVLICAIAGYFILVQTAAVLLEVLSDSDDDGYCEPVLGLIHLPRRRYYPEDRAKRMRTEHTSCSLDMWDDARFTHVILLVGMSIT